MKMTLFEKQIIADVLEKRYKMIEQKLKARK